MWSTAADIHARLARVQQVTQKAEEIKLEEFKELQVLQVFRWPNCANNSTFFVHSVRSVSPGLI